MVKIERLKTNLPFAKGIVSNALVLEIRRLLRKGGIAYFSSVIKNRYGVYFYFKDGSFKLSARLIPRTSENIDQLMSL
jgi:hypothetical protein